MYLKLHRFFSPKTPTTTEPKSEPFSFSSLRSRLSLTFSQNKKQQQQKKQESKKEEGQKPLETNKRTNQNSKSWPHLKAQEES